MTYAIGKTMLKKKRPHDREGVPAIIRYLEIIYRTT
jgi:hypothetical protein